MVNKIKKNGKRASTDRYFMIYLLPLSSQDIYTHECMNQRFSKKILLTVLLPLAIFSATAQTLTLEEEFALMPERSASNCLAYPTPTATQTPAPEGLKPFYLSHYGRHGSRYLTKIKDYDYAYDALKEASEEGKLTQLGESVLRRVSLLREEAQNRWGDLTPVGGRQLQDITRRMVDNYPEIFTDSAHIDARSTLIPRCVLSLTYAVRQLTLMKPKAKMTFDATPHDMTFMNFQDKVLTSKEMVAKARQVYEDYCESHQCWQRMVGSLFNDTAYINKEIDGEQLNYYLFRLAGSVQNTTLANELTLYDIFTADELAKNWRQENAYWYLGYSFSSVNSGKQPYVQRHLLRSIIQEADSCIRLSNPNVRLRFGHETILLPLICLMGINGYDKTVSDLDQLDRQGWINYRVFPMGGNIQLVFYRRDATDKDVFVKVLLNETEARLPIKSKTAPYYRWSDVRAFYLDRLNAYHEE